VKIKPTRRKACSGIWAWRLASRCVTVFALLLALGTTAYSQPSRREIPFENSHLFGLVLVKVEVNGRPAVLIVDTGANQTIISSELGDMRPSRLESAVSTSKGSGWSGTGVFATATLRVGPISWRNHRVLVMDTRDLSRSLGQKIDGMLGIDFFKEFEIVVVNLKNHKLILEP
jgi:predicted aspartyl protease